MKKFHNQDVAFILLRIFDANASPLILESRWHPRYTTLSWWLME